MSDRRRSTVASSCPRRKDAFVIDLGAQTVCCPVGAIVHIRKAGGGGGLAASGVRCATCPQRSQCIANKEGRTIRIRPQKATLHRKRAEQELPRMPVPAFPNSILRQVGQAGVTVASRSFMLGVVTMADVDMVLH
jgi:uncharacterized protein (DUF1499 family)